MALLPHWTTFDEVHELDLLSTQMAQEGERPPGREHGVLGRSLCHFNPPDTNQGQLSTKGQQWRQVMVRSDSMSAIQSLTSIAITSGLVLQLKNLIDILKGEIKITIEWLKTHEGNVGNEFADALGKRRTITITHGCEAWLPMSNDKLP